MGIQAGYRVGEDRTVELVKGFEAREDRRQNKVL